MSEPLLDVGELKKTFALSDGGSVRAVDDVSFSLERGERFGLVGESGSGKSTIARILVGLTDASSGSVRFDGHELVRRSRRAWRQLRARIQMVFQDPYESLDPRMSVGAIVGEPLAIQRRGRPRERRLRTLELLEAVGLDPRHRNRYPHEFSGGQRQRIGIARALALEPELLVCDEPVSALDVSVQAQVLTLLDELCDRFSCTLVFIAHDLAVVRHVCTRVAVLYLGRIVEEAPRDALFDDPRHPYTRALLDAVPVPVPPSRALTNQLAGQLAGQGDPHASASEAVASRAPLVLGDPPDPSDPPGGCGFHPRCARMSESSRDCATHRPALTARKSCGSEPSPDPSPRRHACHLEPVITGETPDEAAG